jgi:hypothetical protein
MENAEGSSVGPATDVGVIVALAILLPHPLACL